MKSKIHKMTKVLFFIYIVAMLWLLFGQRLVTLNIHNYLEQIKYSTNLIPFITIKKYLVLIQNSNTMTFLLFSKQSAGILIYILNRKRHFLIQ